MGWWLLLFSVVYFIYLFAVGLICGWVLIVVVVVEFGFDLVLSGGGGGGDFGCCGERERERGER